MLELSEAVNRLRKELARLNGCESAMVTNGCESAIILATIACIAGGLPGSG